MQNLYGAQHLDNASRKIVQVGLFFYLFPQEIDTFPYLSSYLYIFVIEYFFFLQDKDDIEWESVEK